MIRPCPQISEVNRDQITSIRSIQSILAKITGEPYSEAVFEKFRQFEPFELGVSKADPVLILLSKLDHNTNPDFRNLRSRLRETELQHEDQTQYLSFLKRKYGEETHGAEIEETTINIGLSDDALLKLRLSIIERVISVIDEIVKNLPSGLDKDRTLLKLCRNIYLIITSPVLTRNAMDVETGV